VRLDDLIVRADDLLGLGAPAVLIVSQILLGARGDLIQEEKRFGSQIAAEGRERDG
jgi:hypothetical protein